MDFLPKGNYTLPGRVLSPFEAHRAVLAEMTETCGIGFAVGIVVVWKCAARVEVPLEPFYPLQDGQSLRDGVEVGDDDQTLYSARNRNYFLRTFSYKFSNL